MCRDLTARKQAEASSWKNQQLMQFLLKSSPIVFYTCNIAKGHSFTYVSPSVEELFGYKPESITDTPTFWLLHVHLDDRDQIQFNRISNLIEGRKELEYRVLWPDRSVHWIHLMGELISDDSGSPVRMAGVLSDVTAQKKIRVAPLREANQLS
jgi:PAS domain S-box-containing protein